MADRRCRVTVIGTKHQADVAIPAQGPIGEYACSLAESLDETETDELPAAWSLRLAGGPPLPPYASLDSAGVTDGQLLYLCDLTEGEHDEPLVLEVDENVARTVERIGDRRWTPAVAASVAIVMSVLWLVAGAASWLVTERESGVAAGFLALVASIALAVTAWLGQAERLGLTRPLRLLLAIAAVPCLGVTGWFAGLEWAGGTQGHSPMLGAATVGLAIGLLAGAMAALSAMPGIETLGLAALVGLASPVICLLVVFGATMREVTAVAAVAGYWLVATGPGLAIRLAATWEQFTREEDTERAVVWARVLTLASTCLGAAVTAVALVLMASVRGPFDIALAAVLSCAMLLRAGTCRLLIEAIPIITAGLLGLFAFAMEVAGHLSQGALIPALTDCGLGLVMLSLGVLGTASWPAPEQGADAGRPGLRLSAVPGQPQLVVRVALTLCSIAALPLMLGTFGVYARFISLGHHL